MRGDHWGKSGLAVPPWSDLRVFTWLKPVWKRKSRACGAMKRGDFDRQTPGKEMTRKSAGGAVNRNPTPFPL